MLSTDARYKVAISIGKHWEFLKRCKELELDPSQALHIPIHNKGLRFQTLRHLKEVRAETLEGEFSDEEREWLQQQ